MTQYLQVTLKQKDREIAELKKHLEKLNEERDRVSDVVRQEFADRIVAMEEENKKVKTDMSEQKARHRVELDKARAEVDAIHKAKDEEMEEVHKRVKQAMVKKEEVIQKAITAAVCFPVCPVLMMLSLFRPVQRCCLCC